MDRYLSIGFMLTEPEQFLHWMHGEQEYG